MDYKEYPQKIEKLTKKYDALRNSYLKKLEEGRLICQEGEFYGKKHEENPENPELIERLMGVGQEATKNVLEIKILELELKQTEIEMLKAKVERTKLEMRN